MRKIITSSEAPAPVGPYSQAVLVNDILYISGQIAMDPKTGELKNTDIKTETIQVMENLNSILKEAGFTFADVIKSTIYVTDMNAFAEINNTYDRYFAGNYPARETVGVLSLPKGAKIEISMIAGA